MPKRKKSPKQRKKDKAWKVFSKYIRLRDSDSQGYCQCISCGVTRYWEKDGIQAGHLIASRALSILFDEEIVHAQCAECNYKQGNQVMFWLGLKERYGYKDSKFHEFKKRKNRVRKYTEADYERLTEIYLDKITGLCMQKGIV